MKKILVLLLITINLSSCEKDDICTDETTPQLVLEFYDISNPSIKKPVVNLTITAEGQPSLGTFNGQTKILLPLNTSQDQTKYSLKLNSTSINGSNEDFLEFNYTRQDIFVSRACGFKTIFELNQTPLGLIKSEPTIEDGFWIQDINLLTSNISTENETHIKIYF
jgi:hypothetical protein